MAQNKPIVINATPKSACKPVYDNQVTIDFLNGFLANIDTYITASNKSVVVEAVQKELSRQLSIAKYIGQDCDNTVNTVEFDRARGANSPGKGGIADTGYFFAPQPLPFLNPIHATI